MEDKINVAEILRGMPKGTKLYSPLFGEVKFNGFKGNRISVLITSEYKVDIPTSFSEDGCYHPKYPQSECVLFPSSKMRDWTKFVWKKGDVLVNRDKTTHIIFEEFIDNTYATFTGKYYRSKIGKNGNENVRECSCTTEDFTLETEDAAQTYINTIEEIFGGKLNRETLEIERLPELKDGDIVVYGKSVAICRKIYKHTLYFYASIDEDFGLMLDSNTVSANLYRLATSLEEQQLFDALKKVGKAWDAEKKQIVDLPKYEFKPLDKVLVRDTDDEECCTVQKAD